MRYRILTDRNAWIYGHSLAKCLETAAKLHEHVTNVQVRDGNTYRKAE